MCSERGLAEVPVVVCQRVCMYESTGPVMWVRERQRVRERCVSKKLGTPMDVCEYKC